MELYGKILLFAMPAFLFFVLLEKGYGVLVGKDTLRNMDTISSLSSGITNVVKDVLGLSVSILTYSWLVEHIAIYKIENKLITYIITFIVLDFQGYWVHRWAHEINIFWNKHAIHHSSEDYNLACALRQSISSFINLFTFFLIPAALLGVPKEVIAIVAPIHLFAQFWYHTQHINRMGFLEKIIVTPSHHRVHHAINSEYLDKNYAQIFIIFDKIFGTFQEELPEAPPVYGITRPAATWNPIKINFQHLWLLIKDAWRAENWRDKLTIWFKPTGWRPADVAARYPIPKIDDPYHFEKYEPQSSKTLNAWAWVQFMAVVVLVFYFFGNIGRIGSPNIFIYGGFIFLSVYSYTELMDKNRFALAWETVKNALGLWLIFSTGDWFGMSKVVSWGKYVLEAYFVIATLITAYFVLVEFRNDETVTKSINLSA
ncbi:MAG: sterol desaturase family protein [Saprospiraceae bacterium]|nr:sterol desaturase family protein [Saprospiraceae bacterium]